MLGALVQRGRTGGEGTLVEVSMLEAMAHFAVEPFAAFFALGTVPRSSDRPRLAQAYILRTADGRLIAIHLSSLEKFWTGLVAALDAPELASDARFHTRQARIDNYEALRAELMRGSRDTIWRIGSSGCAVTTCRTPRSTPSRRWYRIRRWSISDSSFPSNAAHGASPVGASAGAVRAASAPNRVRAAPLLDEHGCSIRAAIAGSGVRWPGPKADEDRLTRECISTSITGGYQRAHISPGDG